MAAWPYSTRTWQRLRKAKLATRPLCEDCERQGKLVSATQVDHVTAISKGGAPFPSLDELASLCAPCHARKTRAENGATVAMGCDAEGNPLDPNHPAYGGGQDHGNGTAGDRRGRRENTKFGSGGD